MWQGKRAALLALLSVAPQFTITTIEARIPNRERVVNARQETSHAALKMNSRVRHEGAIEGPAYRGRGKVTDQEKEEADEVSDRFLQAMEEAQNRGSQLRLANDAPAERELSSQYTTCCSKYQNYDSEAMCSLYGEDCSSGGNQSGDKNNGEGSCATSGLSFIGISFSVNTAQGNPYSYQLCDQFPMQNIIDRDYTYIMSMDEDGWLVGGGYKPFDYSGKMPYIDSSHTELVRIGNLNPASG